MGRKKIPEYLIEQALQLYLEGRSTRYIAAKLGIGKSSVSTLLRRLERTDPDLRLYHTIGITLGKNGSDIHEYGRIMHVRNYLKLQGISEDEMEVFMTEIVLACKWFRTPPREIVGFWIQSSNFIGEYGKTPLEVKKTIEEKITLKENISQETLDLAKKKAILFRHCKAIDENYKFLLSNTRFPGQLDVLRKANRELETENRSFRQTIEEQRKQIECLASKEENRDVCYVGRDTAEGELRKLNSITGGRIKPDDVVQIAQDIVKYPSKYPYVFLPIVDKSLAIDEGAESDGGAEYKFQDIFSIRGNSERPSVINEEDKSPPKEKFYPY